MDRGETMTEFAFLGYKYAMRKAGRWTIEETKPNYMTPLQKSAFNAGVMRANIKHNINIEVIV